MLTSTSSTSMKSVSVKKRLPSLNETASDTRRKTALLELVRFQPIIKCDETLFVLIRNPCLQKPRSQYGRRGPAPSHGSRTDDTTGRSRRLQCMVPLSSVAASGYSLVGPGRGRLSSPGIRVVTGNGASEPPARWRARHWPASGLASDSESA